MKTLKQTDLPGLPAEVRALVADGVYSLYELARETPRYILLTKGAEYYFLSENGDLVGAPANVKSLSDIKLGSPVTIPAATGSPRLNIG